MLIGAAVAAAAELGSCELAEPGEPLTVHLVSIAPGEGLMDSMGHTVLLFSGGELDRPRAYNWGVFDSSQPNLVLTFLRGELRYFLMASRWPPLRDLYVGAGRAMVGQRLALEPRAVDALYARVDEVAADPVRREYTYHWADANCATKARDAIDLALGGSLRAALTRPVDTTPRVEAMRHFHRAVIPGFAWDFVTSGRVDAPLTAWERAMLPEHLMREVQGVPGLVAVTCSLNEGRLGWAPPRPNPTWPWAIPGLVGSGLVLASGGRAPRVTGGLVLSYGLVLAVLGTSSLLVWQVSRVEGVGPTTNWLMAGPQTWVLVAVGLRLLRGHGLEEWMPRACNTLALLGLLALPFGGSMLPVLLPGLLACVWAVRAVEAR